MANSQLTRNYKVFQNEVVEPYILVRTLSNGDLIGKSYHEVEGGLTKTEIQLYIKENHVENEIIEPNP